jgi:hypothetical protein
LAYLEENAGHQAQENTECQDEADNNEVYLKHFNLTKKQADLEISKFDMNTVKTNLNSLSM